MSQRRVRVVNMIPRSMSGETNQDSEPQLTVDPERVHTILGTAFTADPAHGPNAPVYASFDGGHTWTLDLVLPGAGGFLWDTFDQSLRFGGGSTLYAGILRGDNAKMNILRSAPYSPTTTMQVEVQRSAIDQPYVDAVHSSGKDRVFVGNNDIGTGKWRGSVEHSADARTLPPPAGFSQSTLDTRTFIRELPSVRAAAHHGGTTYVAYLAMRGTAPKTSLCDVVVARDDNFGSGGTPFTALIDTGDGQPGVRVAISTPIPWTFPFTYLGNQRIGSSLSLAVHPRHSHVVYVAWGGGPDLGSIQTLHVRRSTDHGQTWSGDLLTVPNATNPALAITGNGKVGFLYQQLVKTGSVGRWETHVRVTRDAWATPGEDILLANTPDDSSIHSFDPYLGDYDDLQAVHNEFYGIFSVDNFPDPANFPQGVVYQRNHNFSTKQLLDVNGITPVKNSVDPYFFHISWHEEEEEERECGRERLEIKGLKYERLEIKELKLDFDCCCCECEGEGEGHGAKRAVRRLAHRIEGLAEQLRFHDKHDHDKDDDDDEKH